MAAKSLNLTIRDGENHTSLVTVYFDGTITTADLTTYAAALVAAIDDIIEGQVVRAAITEVISQASSYSGLATADVEIGAQFIFDAAGTVKNKVLTIPSFLRSKLVSGSSNVNLADADVATFVDIMVDGVLALDDPTDSEERDLTAVISAQETYAKKRKR
jgi:hypothetical protein